MSDSEKSLKPCSRKISFTIVGTVLFLKTRELRPCPSSHNQGRTTAW
ncbi:MAG: hypothetical protein QM756_45640 [Polyangiaceae bacterium]